MSTNLLIMLNNIKNSYEKSYTFVFIYYRKYILFHWEIQNFSSIYPYEMCKIIFTFFIKFMRVNKIIYFLKIQIIF